MNTEIISDDKHVYNSVFKIINTEIRRNFMIPYQDSSQSQSVGAGFFINDDGYALTAAHVIENSIQIWVKLPKHGQKIFNAEIISVYPDFDMAMIKVDIKNKYYLKLGNSDNLKLRSTVYTVGYPSNPKYPIVTTGTISGIRGDYFQTDTPINPGNSGGPLLDIDNKVLGITSAVIADSEDSSLIVPINIYNRNKDIMINPKNKLIQKNVLGLVLTNGTQNYNNFHNIYSKKCSDGLVVHKIIKKSPLKNILSPGDLLCSFKINNKIYNIDNFGEIEVPWEIGKISVDKLIKRCIPRQSIGVNFFSIKNNSFMNKNFKLKTYDEVYPIKKLFFPIDKLDYEIFAGMIVMDLTLNHLALKQYSHLGIIIINGQIFEPQLVITHIFPNSKISEYNSISPYTLIKKVNNKKVSNLKDFRKNISKPLVKNNKKYIIIENQNDESVILNTDEIKQQELELTKDFNYNQSNLFSSLFQ